MSVLQYIGARYVPKFYDNPDDHTTNWKSGINYESLTIVTYNGLSYTSKKPVPSNVGNPEDNYEYWALTGEYNASFGYLRNEIAAIKNGGLNDNSLSFNKLNEDAKNIIKDNYKVVFMPNMEHTDVAASNGQSTLFITRYKKKTILYDTNKTHSYAAIKQELINNGVTHIDYFILSHYHFDHYGNIPALQADGFIDATTVVYLPRDVSIVPGWDLIQAEVRGYFTGYDVHTISSTDPLTVDGMRFDFFNCDQSTFDYYETNNQTGGNTYSVCAYVTCDDVTLLMTADIVSYAIDYMAALGKLKPVNVMTVPHHGIGTTSMEIFQQTAPMVAVCSVGAAKEYTHDNATSGSDAYLTSVTIARMEALGIPCYHTGYGAVVMGISDGQFTVLSNGKQCRSYNVNGQRLYFYVNDQFTGLGCGTQTKPFNSLRQALAFVAELKPINDVTINIVGTYNHPDETIQINVPNYTRIVGTVESDTYNVVLKHIQIRDSHVRFESLKITTTDSSGIWATRSKVEIRDCLIDGNTTSMPNVYDGAGVISEGSDVFLSGSTDISNRKCVIYALNGGNVCADPISGSGNTYLVVGYKGGDILFRGSIPTAAHMITPRYSGETPVVSLSTSDRKYSSTGAYLAYWKDHGGTLATDTIDFAGSVYYNHLIRIYGADGTVYQTRKQSNLLTPVQVHEPYTSTEPDFSISVSGDTLTITYKLAIAIEIL